MLLKNYRFMGKIQGLEPVFKENHLSSLISSFSIILNFSFLTSVVLLPGDLLKCRQLHNVLSGAWNSAFPTNSQGKLCAGLGQYLEQHGFRWHNAMYLVLFLQVNIKNFNDVIHYSPSHTFYHIWTQRFYSEVFTCQWYPSLSESKKCFSPSICAGAESLRPSLSLSHKTAITSN